MYTVKPGAALVHMDKSMHARMTMEEGHKLSSYFFVRWCKKNLNGTTAVEETHEPMLKCTIMNVQSLEAFHEL